MANLGFVNVGAWGPDQVSDWIKGLDDILHQYAITFSNNGINGRKLLCLAIQDLNKMHITKIGHQELILEAVELLSNLYSELETENLQSVALRLDCKVRNLLSRMRKEHQNSHLMNGHGINTKQRLSVAILSAVSYTVLDAQKLITWLDRPPFDCLDDLIKQRGKIIEASLDLIGATQQDEKSLHDSIASILKACEELSEVCMYLIRNSTDPLTIQPCSLEMATIKKKPEEELGMRIDSAFNGTHIIEGVKYDTPAFRNGKIEEGDQVVQVNYQTVVGWQVPKMVAALKENDMEVTLTLKKRPHHTNPYATVGRPRKKVNTNLQQSTFPKAMGGARQSKKGNRAPLTDLLTTNTLPPPSEPFNERYKHNADTDTEADLDDNVFDNSLCDSPVYQLDAKHRRATVSGGSPTLKRPSLRINELTSPGRPKSHTIVISSPSSDSSQSDFSLTSPELEVKTLTSNSLSPESITSPPAMTVTSPQPAKIERFSIASEQKIERKIQESVKQREKAELPTTETAETKVTTPKAPQLKSQPGPPLLVKLSPKQNKKSEEVAGSLETGSPQLVSLTRIDSTRRAELYEQDKAGRTPMKLPPTPENKLLEDQRDSKLDRSASYTINVVGGVVQKMTDPAGNSSPKASPKQSPVSILRKKDRSTQRNRFAHLRVNRRISCKDLGQGDCEGWLFKKKETKGYLGSTWAKRWFVLKEFNLYYYKDKGDLRAEGVVYLPGFKVAPADEKKKYAFKAFHSGTTFYFRSDRDEDRTKWMNKLGIAAIGLKEDATPSPGGATASPPPHNDNFKYYSESDEDSDTDTHIGESDTDSVTTYSPSHTLQRHNKEYIDKMREIRKSSGIDILGDKKIERKHTLRKKQERSKERETELKLNSLQRTLKAKENELAAIEKLLGGGKLTPNLLHQFQEEHPPTPDRVSSSSEAEGD